MDNESIDRKEIIMNTFRASQLLHNTGRKLVADQGLTSVQQWFILSTLFREGELALKDLTNNMLVSKQNMTGMVKRLKQGGYVTTFEDPEDRRITRVSITDQGIRVFENLLGDSVVSNERTFAGFTADELSVFANLIERLVGDLQAMES